MTSRHPVVIRPSPARLLLFAIFSGLMTAGGILIVTDFATGRIGVVIGGLVTALCGGATVAYLAQLFPGTTSVTATSTQLTIRWLWIQWEFPWSDVSRIQTVKQTVNTTYSAFTAHYVGLQLRGHSRRSVPWYFGQQDFDFCIPTLPFSQSADQIVQTLKDAR